MNSFFETILEVLRQDERFFTENGELLRNAVVEAAGKMDAKLIKALHENNTTREHFFTTIDGISVFDKIAFGYVVNNREFLPDNYTRYKNKIGLVDSRNDFIANTNDLLNKFKKQKMILHSRLFLRK